MGSKIYYSHGKLLLTNEYLVLDGAKALALPTKQGQYLSVSSSSNSFTSWTSYNADKSVWFKATLDVNNNKLNLNSCSDENIGKTLIKILSSAKSLNPNLSLSGLNINTTLTFNREFGLGTSSTLINNIAQWANVNPFTLLLNAFGGSGYDIACAKANSPIIFETKNNIPSINPIVFNPKFKDHIFFIYLNRKQDSKDGIKRYKSQSLLNKTTIIKQTNAITSELTFCDTIQHFNALVDQHESLISSVINLPTIKSNLFKDYVNGSIKSLGAWGGDFIMVTVTSTNDLDYFKDKGYSTIISYHDMIL